VSLRVYQLRSVEDMSKLRGYFNGVAVVAVLLSASCSSSETNESRPGDAASPEGSSTAGAEAGVPVRIRFGSTAITARLNDTSTARDLAGQLPLTLTFRDLMGQEKAAELPRALSLDGVPDGDDPVPGDIGYWVPDQRLILYYGDVGRYDGIVRIGGFDGARDLIEQQPDGFQVTIERAA
jgi:hypothetical protein